MPVINKQKPKQDRSKILGCEAKGELTDMAEPQRARPKPTPETQHFWDGTNAGELRLQRCNKCAKTYFPPRPFCPACGGREV